MECGPSTAASAPEPRLEFIIFEFVIFVVILVIFVIIIVGIGERAGIGVGSIGTDHGPKRSAESRCGGAGGWWEQGASWSFSVFGVVVGGVVGIWHITIGWTVCGDRGDALLDGVVGGELEGGEVGQRGQIGRNGRKSNLIGSDGGYTASLLRWSGHHIQVWQSRSW